MEENFDLLAQSRANYYTKGSPIQFVKVELLKGNVTGDIAVCLSFKNVTNQPIVALLVEFKCKDRNGEIVCQDQFYYQGLDTSNAQVFGADDAVYISQTPIGSVEVDLLEAYLADGSIIDLSSFARTRLPAPKKLPADLAHKLEARTNKQGLVYVPQVLDQGWYCSCGAFHPREESGVWCSECGADRILLQNTLSNMIQAANPAPQPAMDEQATRMVPPVRPEEPTRAVPPVRAQADPSYNVPPMHNDEEENDDDMIMAPSRPAAAQRAAQARNRYEDDYTDGYDEQGEYEEYEEYGEEDPRDVIAERIIRWAPPITAILCAVVALVGFIMTR